MSDGNGALPEGWAATTVGEIATIKGGKRLPRGASYAGEPTPHAYIRVSDFHNGTIDSSELRYITPEVQQAISRYTISSDNVYISIAGTIGVVGRVPAELDGANLTENAAKIVLAQGIDASYLQRVLTSPEARSQIHFTTIATTQPKLALFRIAALNVPIAPLAEQRRIVSKIESLQERSSRARRALSEVGPLLEQFRQSVLRAAFSGRLTADWRAAHGDVEPATELLSRIRTERRHRWEQSELAKYEAKGKQPPKNWQDKYKEPELLSPAVLAGLPELPDGWCWTNLETLIVDGPTNGYSPKTTPDATGTPALKLSATTQRRLIINEDTIKRLDEIVPDNSKYWLVPGDVLIQRSNSLEYVGAAAFYDGPASTYVYPDIIIRIRVGDCVCRQLLCHLLNSPDGRQFFRDNATGTAGNMPKINGTTIRRTPIPLAPFAEQEAMQKIIDTALESVSTQEVDVAESESALTQLDQSILAKAFRGELVPQDPRDEPASELLARIRTTRDAEATKKPAKRRAKKKAGL